MKRMVEITRELRYLLKISRMENGQYKSVFPFLDAEKFDLALDEMTDVARMNQNFTVQQDGKMKALSVFNNIIIDEPNQRATYYFTEEFIKFFRQQTEEK